MSDPDCTCRKLLNPLGPDDKLSDLTESCTVCEDTRRESCKLWAIKRVSPFQYDSPGEALAEFDRKLIEAQSRSEAGFEFPLPDGRKGRCDTSNGGWPIIIAPTSLLTLPIRVPRPPTSKEPGIILVVQQWIGEDSDAFRRHILTESEASELRSRVNAILESRGRPFSLLSPLLPMPLPNPLKPNKKTPEEREAEERREAEKEAQRTIDEKALPHTQGARNLITAEYADEKPELPARAGLLTTLIRQLVDSEGNPCNSTIIQDFSLSYSGNPSALFEKAGEKAKCHIRWWEAIAEKSGMPLRDMDMRQYNSSKSPDSAYGPDFVPQTPDQQYEHNIETACSLLAKLHLYGDMSVDEARFLLRGYAKPAIETFPFPRVWADERRRLNKMLDRKISELEGS